MVYVCSLHKIHMKIYKYVNKTITLTKNAVTHNKKEIYKASFEYLAPIKKNCEYILHNKYVHIH